jgi:hypothetical protein
MSLWAVGWICTKSAVRPQRGLEAAEEAAGLFATLAQRLPAVYLTRWRSAQSTRADLLEVLGRGGEAAEIRRLLEPGDG